MKVVCSSSVTSLCFFCVFHCEVSTNCECRVNKLSKCESVDFSMEVLKISDCDSPKIKSGGQR